MKYNRDLWKDPQWQKKRLKIIERDKWKCVGCGAETNMLSVHHITYLSGAEGPWDYPDGVLTTLCEDCHETIKDYVFYLGGICKDCIDIGLINIKKLHEIWDKLVRENF